MRRRHCPCPPNVSTRAGRKLTLNWMARPGTNPQAGLRATNFLPTSKENAHQEATVDEQHSPDGGDQINSVEAEATEDWSAVVSADVVENPAVETEPKDEPAAAELSERPEQEQEPLQTAEPEPEPIDAAEQVAEARHDAEAEYETPFIDETRDAAEAAPEAASQIAGLSSFDFPAERHFEPEHGDTDWSETESVQAALDIAAARQARGEEMGTPEPDYSAEEHSSDDEHQRHEAPATEEAVTAPAPVPVFARSRRRPMTSLDDLITPEGREPDTVADAVSQALADNALDRQEGAVAPAEGIEGIADESFDVETQDDPSLIDEEALRDLIAQVVREELQGVLGQRITRNVRKMVRREIRLALAAETFD